MDSNTILLIDAICVLVTVIICLCVFIDFKKNDIDKGN